MAEQSSSSSSDGIGVLGLLGVAFVVLKLTHVIDWPWKWVTAPFWFGIALVAVVLLFIAIVGLVATISDKRDRRRIRNKS